MTDVKKEPDVKKDEKKDPVKDPEKDPPKDPVSQLRDEMAAQFDELKKAFAEETSEKDKLIADLKEQNKSLQRALVRSAVNDPPAKEAEKTSEDLYNEKVQALAKKSWEYTKLR